MDAACIEKSVEDAGPQPMPPMVIALLKIRNAGWNSSPKVYEE